MSTYVVSMIEVRNGGEWELLRIFRRDDYIKCEADGAFPKDLTWTMTKEYVEDNEESTTIGYIENSANFSEDYSFQDFLLDTDRNYGYIDSNLGMPEDASPLTIKKYEEYGHNASVPSYFYLVDILGAWHEMVDNFKKELPQAQRDKALDDINNKLNTLLALNGVKSKKNDDSDEKTFNVHHFTGAFNEILNVYSEICRIRTLVETQYGDLKTTDIRVIWFIY